MVEKTQHIEKEREERVRKIKEAYGEGTVLDRIYVDRGHKDGPEIHEIDSRGVITIYNANTGRLVTQLIARPGQIRRYYKNTTYPAWYHDLCTLCEKHKQDGANNW